MKLYIINVLFQYMIIVVECGELNHIMYVISYRIGLSGVTLVHRYASKVVLNGDTGWISNIVRRKLDSASLNMENRWVWLVVCLCVS